MISTKQLHYNSETGVLSGEVSELELGGKLALVRAYPDACDVGIEVVSHVTGKVVVFAENGIDTDDDDDILAWHYTPVITAGMPASVRRLRLTIYND